MSIMVLIILLLPRTIFYIVFLLHNFISHNDCDLILSYVGFISHDHNL